MKAIRTLFLAMRPVQWTKNLILFAGLIFSINFFNVRDVFLTVNAFFLYCLLSSSIYIINDIVDIDRDRLHPLKCKRPVASGELSVKRAITFAFFLVFLSLLYSYFLEFYFFLTSMVYFLLNLTYSLWFKKVIILDVLSIAMSFVLRAVAGVVIINVIISPWLLMCTFLLALFMAIGKRRGEMLCADKNYARHREVLSDYDISLLDQMISVVASSLLLAYSLYTFTSGRSIVLMVTIPFVLYGIFRYLYLVYQEKRGDNPTSIFISDRPLQINMLFWILLIFLIIYWKNLKGLLGFL